VREGHLDIAKLLLDRGAQVDVLDPDDFTPLHNAAWNGNLDMAKLLLEAGADIEASTYDGDTPLSLAQDNNQPKVAEFILVKLQPVVTDETKLESTAASDSGIRDVSGTYVMTNLTGNWLAAMFRSTAAFRSKPIITMAQNGDQLTGTYDEGRGKFWGEIKGDTIKLDWAGPMATARGKWTFKPGSNESSVSLSANSGIGEAKFNLTKIDTGVVDVSGTYISEVTGPYRRKLRLNGANPEVKLVQEGSKVTGTFEPGGKLWGDVNGDSIELDYTALGGWYGKVNWKVKPGSNEVVGTWAHNKTVGKDGNWTLTRIE